MASPRLRATRIRLYDQAVELGPALAANGELAMRSGLERGRLQVMLHNGTLEWWKKFALAGRDWYRMRCSATVAAERCGR